MRQLSLVVLRHRAKVGPQGPARAAPQVDVAVFERHKAKLAVVAAQDVLVLDDPLGLWSSKSKAGFMVSLATETPKRPWSRLARRR